MGSFFMSSSPIGFFDSGIGGLTVWRKVKELLPYENTLYLSDSKNCPYGYKSVSEINKICQKNVQFLLNKKCKLIVVACNTATTNSISNLRKKFKVPIIGIEPAIKPAAIKSKAKIIGILATKGTLNSDLFFETSSDNLKKIKLVRNDCHGLVELIEKRQSNEKDLNELLKKYLDPMVNEGIDQLVLGCTHYLIIKKNIQRILNKKIDVIDCTESVAIQTKKVLQTKNLLNDNKIEKTKYLFYNNGADDFKINQVLKNKYEIFKFDI